MKNFTKYVLSAALMTGFYTTSFSQDAGVTAGLVPTPSSFIYPNVPQSLGFTLSNFTSTAVTTAVCDSMIIELRVGGNLVQTSYAIPAGNLVLPGNGSLDLYNNQPTDWSTLSLGNGQQTVSICIKSRLKKNSNDVDVNTSNDETCYTVTYAGDNNSFTYDIEPTTLLVTVPPYPANAYVPLGGIALELTYLLKNSGSSDLFPGVPYTYDITVAGSSVTTIDANVIGFVSQGGDELHTLGNQSITFPVTAGPFDLCIEIAPNSDDTDNSNDKSCTTYNAGNPAAIEDVDAPVFGDITYFNNTLSIIFNELAKGTATLNVYETSGRAVGVYNFDVDNNKNQIVDMNNLSTGVYIANLTVNGTVLTYKFGVNE